MDSHQTSNQLLETRKVTEIATTIEADLKQAEALVKQGNIRKAIPIYRRVTKLNPQESKYWIKLANTLAKHQELDEAVKYYQKVIELQPDISYVYLSLGNVLLEQRKYQEAIAQYQQGIICNSDADNLPLHLKIQEVYAKQNKLEELIADYRQDLEQTPNSMRTYYLLAEALSKQNNRQEAEIYYRKVIELNPPPNYRPYEQLARILQQQGKLNEAINCYQQAVLENPKNTIIHTRLAKLLYQQGHLKLAVQSYRQATEVNPEFHLAYPGLGECLELLGDSGGAILAWRQYLNLKPDDSHIFFKQGLLLAKHKQWEEALFCYKNAIKIQPEKAIRDYLHLGLVIARCSKLEPQITQLCQNLFKHKNPYHIYSAAILLAELGKIDEAISCFKNSTRSTHILESNTPPPNLPLPTEIYDYLWQNLNQKSQVDFDGSQILDVPQIETKDAENYFRENSKYRVLTSTFNPEGKKLLDDLGISLVKLELIYLDTFALEEIYINSFSNAAKKRLSRKSEPTREEGRLDLKRWTEFRKNGYEFAVQQSIAETGYIYSICPISGEILRSNQSFYLGASLIAYRFVGAEIFYLIIGQWFGNKIAVYFPKFDLILTQLGKKKINEIENLKSRLNIFKSYTVKYRNEFLAYVSNSVKHPLVALVGNTANFYHYFFNRITGLNYLSERNLIPKIDKIITGNNNYFDISSIYPNIETKEVNTEDELFFQETLANNYFIAMFFDVILSHSLAQTLHKSSLDLATPKLIETVKSLRKSCFPLIWFHVRIHKRLWLSQIEGTANLIQRLYQDFPNLGIIFDGFSCTNSGLVNHQVVTQEKAIFKQITDRIPPEISVQNLIGCKVYEKIIWAQEIDLYVLQHGSAMTIPMIVNKPGVAHQNTGLHDSEFEGDSRYTQTDVMGQQFSYMMMQRDFAYRENVTKPIYIPKKYITDQNNSGKHWRNYDLDWKVIYAEVLRIINYLRKEN
ncbi:MAG: tetratricopeptide repeat protein [Microcoleaceae cyanobacterium MO_207.B10]|nr:tetratricopeptide repeat protein [Microcoleaceae cyanobacterium MO_207.B10]